MADRKTVAAVEDPNTFNDPRLTHDNLEGTEEQQLARARQLQARRRENAKQLGAK